MKSYEKIFDQSEKVMKMAEADDVEILVSSTDKSLTRFASNIIHQNVQNKDTTITIKLIKDGVVGKATVNQWDDDYIKDALKKAATACEFGKVDPDMPELPAKQEYHKIEAFDKKTAELSPEFRARKVERATRVAASKGLEAAGIFSNQSDITALANSKGLFACHEGTQAAYSLTASDGDVSGWAEDQSHNAADILYDHLVEKAIADCQRAKKPKTIEPGKYTVILPPDASGEFLYFMAYHVFNGLAFAEGRSPFSGKIGEKLFGDNLTITDDAYHEKMNGIPFDFEGMPRQRVSLVENGVAKGVVHDSRSAKMLGVKSTGHAFPLPNPYGAIPMNLVVAAGKSNIAEMVSTTERGLYITHFHYTNVIDPMQQTVTGMTRDGVFMIEDGKIVHPVVNLRFTESAFKAYSNIISLTENQKKTAAGFGDGFVVPGMKIKNFNFTSTTEF